MRGNKPVSHALIGLTEEELSLVDLYRSLCEKRNGVVAPTRTVLVKSLAMKELRRLIAKSISDGELPADFVPGKPLVETPIENPGDENPGDDS